MCNQGMGRAHLVSEAGASYRADLNQHSKLAQLMWKQPEPIRGYTRTKILMLTLLQAVLVGCTTTPSVDALLTSPMPHESASAPEGIRDERSRFQEIFCTALREEQSKATSMGCDYWLFAPAPVQSPAFPAQDTQPGLATLSDKIQLLIITGAFSDCFGPDAIAFADATGVLQSAGVSVQTDVVSGRSGTASNAQQIADYIETRYDGQGPPLVLVGYSKGTNDALQFLTQYPELATRVSALVSVGGAVGGSPVADGLYPIYDLLLSHLPWPQCDAGDGEVAQSLRTQVREEWLQAHTLPNHMRYYSVSAITSSDRTARVLRPTWKSLLKHSPHNDGQVLARHALIPGSTLLAYLHADHWSIALRVERSREVFAYRPHYVEFPQAALLSAITQLVAEDLQQALK
jgi:pimeloyl-ACP methyl ester carboxylesterase